VFCQGTIDLQFFSQKHRYQTQRQDCVLASRDRIYYCMFDDVPVEILASTRPQTIARIPSRARASPTPRAQLIEPVKPLAKTANRQSASQPNSHSNAHTLTATVRARLQALTALS